MTRSIRPATEYQEFTLARALILMREARNMAQKSNSPRAIAAIRRALKSVEGALRHMHHRRRRTKESKQ